MKVLIAASTYPPDAGGPASHAKKQVDGFPKLGIETKLVALAHYRKWPIGVRHFLYFLALLKVAKGVDLVYGHDAVGAGIPALIAARICNKKFIVRIGGDVAWERHAEVDNVSMLEWYADRSHKKDLMFKLSRWLLLHADLVIVISPLQLDVYKKYYGVSPKKITLVLNPIPKPQVGVVEPEDSLVFASRLTAYKNLPAIFQALKKVILSYPQLKFVVMGHGPEEVHLHELVKELGLENNVIFTGGVSGEEVSKRTAACLFLIAPALTEFNPNYIMEGVGLGKPFLLSREQGLPVEVPEEYLFNPRNIDEIAQKIESLMDKNNYLKAKKFVNSINLQMSWDDNLRANSELIKALVRV